MRVKLGTPHLHLRETGSTNDRARELATGGAPHGTLVTTEHQVAGRGRQGRAWTSPPRRALLMSLVLREVTPLLTIAAGVAVADAVGAGTAIKWPNDVLLDGRKVAGILAEARPREGWAVLGIGLNVALRPDDFHGSRSHLTFLDPKPVPLRWADPRFILLANWQPIDEFAEIHNSPPFRDRSEFRILELVRKESGGGGVEASGLAAIEFGADGVEIHEPALEERPRHRLQRRVHPPVQLDLVVQRSKHCRDGFLLGERRQRDP